MLSWPSDQQNDIQCEPAARCHYTSPSSREKQSHMPPSVSRMPSPAHRSVLFALFCHPKWGTLVCVAKFCPLYHLLNNILCISKREWAWYQTFITKKHVLVLRSKTANNRCTFHILSNAFRGIKRPQITIWICQSTTAPSCPCRGLRVHFDTDSYAKKGMDFILTSHNTLSIVVTVKHIPNNRLHHFSCQLWVTLTETSKKQDPPTTPTSLLRFLWQQYLLMICLVDKQQSQSVICNVWQWWKSPYCVAECWTGPGVLSVKSKALPPALWHCLWSHSLLHARGDLWSF